MSLQKTVCSKMQSRQICVMGCERAIILSKICWSTSDCFPQLAGIFKYFIFYLWENVGLVTCFSIVAVLLVYKNYTAGTPVYFPLNGTTFVRKTHFVVWAAELIFCISPIKETYQVSLPNMHNLFCSFLAPKLVQLN